jgi:hypothetical protein
MVAALKLEPPACRTLPTPRPKEVWVCAEATTGNIAKKKTGPTFMGPVRYNLVLR